MQDYTVTFAGDNSKYLASSITLPKTVQFQNSYSMFPIDFNADNIKLSGNTQEYEIKEGQTISVADGFSISSSNTLTIKGTLKF